jgi:hypothetical protein
MAPNPLIVRGSPDGFLVPDAPRIDAPWDEGERLAGADVGYHTDGVYRRTNNTTTERKRKREGERQRWMKYLLSVSTPFDTS